MNHSVFRHQDFIAGGLFCLTGLAVAAGSRQYPLGTAMRMGAGYFPLVLGGLLALLGVFVLLRSIMGHRRNFRDIGQLMLRPVALIGAGVLTFAVLLGSVGLAGSTVLLVAVSGAAHHESRWRELLPLGMGLAIFGVGVFVWGLGMPLPVLPF
jgi:hypothetical protein